MATNDTEVWAGCLACYNAGNLVGQWVDVHEVADTDDPHDLTGCTDDGLTGHEEVGFLDVEDPHGLFGPGEPTFRDVLDVAFILDELDDDPTKPEAFAAFRAGRGRAPGETLVDVLNDFEDRIFYGAWRSFYEFVVDVDYEATDPFLGLDVPDDHPVRLFFDWRQYAESLEVNDFDTLTLPSGDVAVFSY